MLAPQVANYYCPLFAQMSVQKRRFFKRFRNFFLNVIYILQEIISKFLNIYKNDIYICGYFPVGVVVMVIVVVVVVVMVM